MSRIVSDLVVQAHAAAAESLAWHFHVLLKDRARSDWARIVQAVDFGYASDLDERTSEHQPVGFDHLAISRVFRRRLRPILHGTGLSHHIWEQDEKNQGFYSLFPRETMPSGRQTPRRTRASAIVQQLLRDCRDFRQADKATRANDLNLQVTIPSPLAVAGRLLADPSSEGSQTYAWAALQEWVRERIEQEIGGPIDVSFAAVSEALTTINNPWKTSKPIIADLAQNGATVVFVCNVLALRGLAAMRVDAGYLSDTVEWQASAPLSTLDDPEFSVWSMTQQMDHRLAMLWLGDRNASGEFLINPRVVDLPSAGELLNLIEGLPVPFEGGDTVFQGGVRLSSDRSLVATISGDFGTGKTLFGLGLAAALAPLGCRTLFLSCEESAADITNRLVEAAPRALFRNMPLFKALNPEHFRLGSLNTPKAGEMPALGWFSAGQLEVTDAGQSLADPTSALEALLRDAREYAEIFRPFRENQGGDVRLPRFARPVIIIDGLHQLFDSPDSWDLLDSSLRSLIDTCRDLGAIFLFSFAKEAGGLERLEYLCDLIIEVERAGHDKPSEAPYRIFQLLKARRQPARTGAHLFHIKGDEGFRLKPSVDARMQDLKAQMWWSPTERQAVFLTSGTPQGFRQTPDDAPAQTLAVANHSQMLVIGHGSSGKAGFGLYVLHRRWFDTDLLVNDRQRRLPIGSPPELPKWKQVLAQSGLPIRSEPQYLETRVLVISFLYQRSYYDELTKRLSAKRRGKPERLSEDRYGPIDAMEPMEFAPLPDRLWTDTIELYPGMLSVEDFLAKVEKRLTAAERSGFPYTGVLVDGLHNVFVQFPALENESAFWGMFYNVLRRRRVTVVTTHTEFDISGKHSRGHATSGAGMSMSYDFAQAERKIAPLLSALVSGADYLFDLSPSTDIGSEAYLLTPRAVLGDNISGRVYAWDKGRLQLEAAPDLARVRRIDERPDMAIRLAQNLVRFMS